MSDCDQPHIVHIIYSLAAGGLENGLVNIINRCPVNRYRHTIICLTSAHEFATRITAPGVKIIELDKNEGHDWGMYRRLLKLLKTLQPEIIHTRNLAALDTQILGLFLPGVKHVHGEHGRDIYDLDGNNTKYKLLRKFMRIFIDRYIVVSLDMETWLKESIGVSSQRLVQIYNGVDWDNFQPSAHDRNTMFPAGFISSDSTLVLGSVGRLVEVKDQRLIIMALRAIVDRDFSWRNLVRLVMVGDGPLMNDLRQLAVTLELDDLIWFTGDRSDVAALLRKMDIFILPSLGEGISNTVLEAMATGLPVIATNVGGNPELVQQDTTGLLIPVGNVTALCDAMERLLQSAQLTSTLGEAGRRRVKERFNWDTTVHAYLRTYDELLGTAGNGTIDGLKFNSKDQVGVR